MPDTNPTQQPEANRPESPLIVYLKGYYNVRGGARQHAEVNGYAPNSPESQQAEASALKQYTIQALEDLNTKLQDPSSNDKGRLSRLRLWLITDQIVATAWQNQLMDQRLRELGRKRGALSLREANEAKAITETLIQNQQILFGQNIPYESIQQRMQQLYAVSDDPIRNAESILTAAQPSQDLTTEAARRLKALQEIQGNGRDLGAVLERTTVAAQQRAEQLTERQRTRKETKEQAERRSQSEKSQVRQLEQLGKSGNISEDAIEIVHRISMSTNDPAILKLAADVMNKYCAQQMCATKDSSGNFPQPFDQINFMGIRLFTTPYTSFATPSPERQDMTPRATKIEQMRDIYRRAGAEDLFQSLLAVTTLPRVAYNTVQRTTLDERRIDATFRPILNESVGHNPEEARLIDQFETTMKAIQIFSPNGSLEFLRYTMDPANATIINPDTIQLNPHPANPLLPPNPTNPQSPAENPFLSHDELKRWCAVVQQLIRLQYFCMESEIEQEILLRSGIDTKVQDLLNVPAVLGHPARVVQNYPVKPIPNSLFLFQVHAATRTLINGADIYSHNLGPLGDNNVINLILNKRHERNGDGLNAIDTYSSALSVFLKNISLTKGHGENDLGINMGALGQLSLASPAAPEGFYLSAQRVGNVKTIKDITPQIVAEMFAYMDGTPEDDIARNAAMQFVIQLVSSNPRGQILGGLPEGGKAMAQLDGLRPYFTIGMDNQKHAMLHGISFAEGGYPLWGVKRFNSAGEDVQRETMLKNWFNLMYDLRPLHEISSIIDLQRPNISGEDMLETALQAPSITQRLRDAYHILSTLDPTAPNYQQNITNKDQIRAHAHALLKEAFSERIPGTDVTLDTLRMHIAQEEYRGYIDVKYLWVITRFFKNIEFFDGASLPRAIRTTLQNCRETVSRTGAQACIEPYLLQPQGVMLPVDNRYPNLNPNPNQSSELVSVPSIIIDSVLKKAIASRSEEGWEYAGFHTQFLLDAYKSALLGTGRTVDYYVFEERTANRRVAPIGVATYILGKFQRNAFENLRKLVGLRTEADVVEALLELNGLDWKMVGDNLEDIVKSADVFGNGFDRALEGSRGIGKIASLGGGVRRALFNILRSPIPLSYDKLKVSAPLAAAHFGAHLAGFDIMSVNLPYFSDHAGVAMRLAGFHLEQVASNPFSLTDPGSFLYWTPFAIGSIAATLMRRVRIGRESRITGKHEQRSVFNLPIIRHYMKPLAITGHQAPAEIRGTENTDIIDELFEILERQRDTYENEMGSFRNRIRELQHNHARTQSEDAELQTLQVRLTATEEEWRTTNAKYPRFLTYWRDHHGRRQNILLPAIRLQNWATVRPGVVEAAAH